MVNKCCLLAELPTQTDPKRPNSCPLINAANEHKRPNDLRVFTIPPLAVCFSHTLVLDIFPVIFISLSPQLPPSPPYTFPPRECHPPFASAGWDFGCCHERGGGSPLVSAISPNLTATFTLHHQPSLSSLLLFLLLLGPCLYLLQGQRCECV